MAKRLRSFAILIVLLCGAGACPEEMPAPGARPTLETWVRFTVNAPVSQQTARGTTIRNPVRVDDKAQVNAGVEFEARVMPAGINVTVVPSRLGETARDAELVIEVPAGAPVAEYIVTVRAHLTFAGGGAPDWSETSRLVEVVTGQGGFSMFCNPADLTLAAGARRDSRLPDLPRGRFQTRRSTLSFSPFGEFLTITPTTARLESNQVGFAFTVARRPQLTPPPTITFRAIGRGGGFEREVTVRVLLPQAIMGR